MNLTSVNIGDIISLRSDYIPKMEILKTSYKMSEKKQKQERIIFALFVSLLLVFILSFFLIGWLYLFIYLLTYLLNSFLLVGG